MIVKFLDGTEKEIKIEPGANLQGANLQGADLRWANLQGTNLQGADLRRADLRGAYLRWANLRVANLLQNYTSNIISITNRGNSFRTVTYILSTNTIYCGCFIGSLDKFKNEVDEKYNGKGTYYAAIKLFEEVRKCGQYYF